MEEIISLFNSRNGRIIISEGGILFLNNTLSNNDLAKEIENRKIREYGRVTYLKSL